MESIRDTQKVDLERAEMLLEQAKPNVALEVFDEPTVAALKEAMELHEKWEEKEKVGEVYEYWGMYQNSIRKFKTSITFYQKAMDIRLRLYGEENQSVWRLYNIIGEQYSFLNDFESAKTYLYKGLELALTIFGEQHLNTAKSYSAIGVWCFYQDYFSKAIEYFYKCIEIGEAINPSPILFLQGTYTNIATNYIALFDYGKALHFFQKGMILLKKLRPPMHLDFANIFNSYANLYHRLGDINRAVLFAQKSIEIYDHHQHVNVIYPCRLLMGIYKDQGAEEKAMQIGEKAVQVLLKHNMEKQRATIILYTTLSKSYQKVGRKEEAFTLLEKAIQIAKELYGAYSPRLSSSIKSMADYYTVEGMFDKAEVYFHKALEILNHSKSEKRIGNTHIYSSLGKLYEESQKPLEAVKAYHQVICFATVGYDKEDIYDYPFFDLKDTDFEIKQEYGSWLEAFLSKAHAFFQYYTFQTKDLTDLEAAFRGYETTF
ncbi:MAG: tetratricopeptide repeat protein, partial [Chitinophagales bacterium]